MDETTVQFDFERLNVEAGGLVPVVLPHSAGVTSERHHPQSQQDDLWEFPPEPSQSPFIYSARHMTLPVSIHKSIAWIIPDTESRSRGYQELMHAYLHQTADRLAACSPCYIELWRSYVPTLAFGLHGSGALLNAMVALAALHLAPLLQEPPKGRERAVRYYFVALQEYHDMKRSDQLTDAGLATVLLFAHFEVSVSI